MTVYYHPESDSHFIAPPNFLEVNQGIDAQHSIAVEAHSVPAYTPISVGFGRATSLPDMDFETYSEAGFVWDESAQRWRSVNAGSKGGIFAVGAAVYSEHPSTEVLSLAYNLKDGKGRRLWLPGMPPPQDLFDHIAAGGLIEAHNSGFEWLIWTNVCWRRMGWPALPLKQLRCSMAKARAWSIPGALGNGAKFLGLDIEKDADGQRLLKKFSIPRNPTKKDARLRIDPLEDEEGCNLYAYNDQDIVAESELSAHVPDLIPTEVELWLTDQRINMRGAAIDVEAVEACIKIVEQAREIRNAELRHITGGEVSDANKREQLLQWLHRQGAMLPNMQGETITRYLGQDLPSHVRAALEIREELGSSSVAKLYAISRQVSYDNRLRELFKFCGADRTGRFAGQGAQPQNFPSGGSTLTLCSGETGGCGRYYSGALKACPECNHPDWACDTGKEWNAEAAEQAISDIKRGLDYRALAHLYGNPVQLISGCLRGLFVASEGYDLICSDYSAIEAVVLAALAGEEWRLEVFRTHGKIYEMSASKITGIPFDEFLRHKEETGDHHPMRKKVGKVAELASGYQGGYGAWCAFGADKHLNEPEIREAIKKWRGESPAIVDFWYAMERCAVDAVRFAGTVHSHNGIAWCMRENVLYCRLLSGRLLAYHQPRLTPDVTPWGKEVLKLSYLGTDQGRIIRIDTYGGKLTENVVQATARDILTHALVELEKRGYPIVLHVHDEIVAEIAKGFGSVAEFEAIMADLPQWCRGWPIRAAGGWRGKRYRKD